MTKHLRPLFLASPPGPWFVRQHCNDETVRSVMTDTTDWKTIAMALAQRINPQYADQRGTESYERKECADMLDALLQRNAELEALLKCVATNLSKGMSKSIQKLQAKTIEDDL